MTIPHDDDTSSLRLHRKIMSDTTCSGKLKTVLSHDDCDVDASYLGCVATYEALAGLIPLDRVVYDLGCGFAVQSYYFRHHRRYVGVDLVPVERRFVTGNSEHYERSIESFCDGFVPDEPAFAICNWVPPWHGDNGAFVRARFRHLFVFYPESRCREFPPRLPAPEGP